MSVIKRSHWIIAVALLLSVIACTTSERQTSSGDVTRVDTEHEAESDQMTMPTEKARRTEEAAAGTTSMNAKRIHALPATAPQFHADREISLRQNTEKYQHIEPHPIKLVMEQPVPPANLVFLIDVSGSMEDANKLPLLKQAFRALTRHLRPTDRVSLVVYAGASGVVLEPTTGSEQRQILAALDRLQVGGSTHGAAGIELAYQVARQAFIPGGINRVLLATDGDFNVGITNFEHLKNLIERQRASGVALSTLGFGTGNYNDHLMEQLADAGNGNYSYIDTANEARKVLIDEFSSTMATIAKDVKIQVEFNPAAVAEYRLIGYDNRALRREDFNNDRVDAGEIGAGHAVTALYEIRLVGRGKSLVDPLRYQPAATPAGNADELAHVRLRYKLPSNEHSELMSRSVRTNQVMASFDAASEPLRFAAAVAAFGQQLQGGHHLGSASGFGYDDIVGWARNAIGNDPYGYRAEFTELVNIAHNLSQIAPQARNQDE